jgi:hypothetical protein
MQHKPPLPCFRIFLERFSLFRARPGCFSKYIGQWGRGEQFAGTKKLAGRITRLGRELVPAFQGRQVVAVHHLRTWPPVVARGQGSVG